MYVVRSHIPVCVMQTNTFLYFIIIRSSTFDISRSDLVYRKLIKRHIPTDTVLVRMKEICKSSIRIFRSLHYTDGLFLYRPLYDILRTHTDISMIHEPWIRGSTIHGFGQPKNRLFYNRAGKRPRAVIHLSPNIDAMLLNQFTDDDLVAVRVCRSVAAVGDFIVVSSYLSYDSKIPPPGPSLEKVEAFCRSKRIPMIICMDTNAPHTIWGSSNTSSNTFMESHERGNFFGSQAY